MTQQLPPRLQPDVVQDMKTLIFEIARALVDDPDTISVEAIEDQGSTVLRLRVSQKDVGKVIGKQGRTARSLRTILGAASMKMHHRFSLDILEHGERPRSSAALAAVSEDQDQPSPFNSES
jgi:predicted RNA-binding protein YlqC (UPF0109 family)